MGRRHVTDVEVNARVRGDFLLKEWGRAERIRFPGWPTADILWIATQGTSHGTGGTQDLRPDLQLVADALRALARKSQQDQVRVDICDKLYVRGWRDEAIIEYLHLSRGTLKTWLRDTQMYVSAWIDSHEPIDVVKKSA